MDWAQCFSTITVNGQQQKLPFIWRWNKLRSDSMTWVNFWGWGLACDFSDFCCLLILTWQWEEEKTSEPFHPFVSENSILKSIKAGLVHEGAVIGYRYTLFSKHARWPAECLLSSIKPYKIRFEFISMEYLTEWKNQMIVFFFRRIRAPCRRVSFGWQSAPAKSQYIRERKHFRVLGTRGKVLCSSIHERQRGWVLSASDQTRNPWVSRQKYTT